MSQLKGLTVLELASVLAGPSVGQFFAELGADVIKVENLKTGGDVTRSWKLAGEKTGDRSAYFCSVNWGKKSIAIDLTLQEGRDIVQRLAAAADIVIASYKPGDAEKLGVDYKSLSSKNPGLIYGQTTGYGSQNPRVGYDAVIQAEAGFMFMNGEPGGASLKMPVALMDILAGHQLKEGLLLAMLDKMATGRGRLVEVSLIQAAVASLANQASNWLVANKLPKKQGSAHPNIAPYGDVFTTVDGQEIILAVGSDQQFQSLCIILKISHLYDDRRWRTNAARVENRDLLTVEIQREVGMLTADALLSRVHAAKIPAGVINDMKKVFEMPEARQMMFELSGLQGIKTYVAGPDSALPSHFLPPPHFGENTRSVLNEFLNLTDSEVEKLLSQRVIA